MILWISYRIAFVYVFCHTVGESPKARIAHSMLENPGHLRIVPGGGGVGEGRNLSGLNFYYIIHLYPAFSPMGIQSSLHHSVLLHSVLTTTL